LKSQIQTYEEGSELSAYTSGQTRSTSSYTKTTTTYDGEQYTTYEEEYSDNDMGPLVQRFGQITEGEYTFSLYWRI